MKLDSPAGISNVVKMLSEIKHEIGPSVRTPIHGSKWMAMIFQNNETVAVNLEYTP